MKKELSQKERAIFQTSINKLHHNNTEIIYCLANKESGTGLFTNERLIIINSTEKSITYCSKEPQLPLTEISSLPKGKKKIYVEKVKMLMCRGKDNIVELSWNENNSNEKWVFNFNNNKMANEWVSAVQNLIYGKTNKEEPSANKLIPNSNKSSNFNQSNNQQNSNIQNSSLAEKPNNIQVNQSNEKVIGGQQKEPMKIEEAKFILPSPHEEAAFKFNPQLDSTSENKLVNKISSTQLKPLEVSINNSNISQAQIDEAEDYISTKRDPKNSSVSMPTEPKKSPMNQTDLPFVEFYKKEIKKDSSLAQLTSIKDSARSKYYSGVEEEENASSKNEQSKQNEKEKKKVTKKTKKNIRSEFGSEKKSKAGNKKWNELWCSNGDSLDIYEEFIRTCQTTCVEIIDELPFSEEERQYQPAKYESPYFMYLTEGIIFILHFFSEEPIPSSSSRSINEQSPILYDHETYTESKREFYNYNFILAQTANQGFIKVPLSCYLEYKGIIVFCRAAMPEGFEKVFPQQYERQIESLEQQLKMRFVFDSMTIYAHPQRKYLIISELEELIPRFPNESNPPTYFRKEFLIANEIMIDDPKTIQALHQKLTEENIQNFIEKNDSLDSWSINSDDFLKELHRAGLSCGNLSTIYEEANLEYFKRVILSEMAKGVICDILRSELNSVYANFPMREFEEELTTEFVNTIILDCTQAMLDELFSCSSKSRDIWETVSKEVYERYQVEIEKKNLLVGYLLSGIMSCLGINCNFKVREFERKNCFALNQNVIPRKMLTNFYSKIRRYDLNSICPQIAQIQEILLEEPTLENFESLISLLDLQNVQIPSYLFSETPEILSYLSNFVPFGDQNQYNHIGIYDMIELEPHNRCSTKICLFALKWAAKNNNEELAHEIFETKWKENSFWGGEFNPSFGEYYDFFSLYNVSVGNYEESAKLARSSLINSIKLTGPDSLPVADKHYQFGNILFKIGKKEESLKEYIKTKRILDSHNHTTIPEYGIILLKLSLLYLNFGKINDCVGHSLEALKVFENNGGSEQDEIEIFEILSRCYEITRKTGDLSNVAALCTQKFNMTQNPKIFERMAKIVLLPKLASLDSHSSKIISKLFMKLEELPTHPTPANCFKFINTRSQTEIIMKKINYFIDNIEVLMSEVKRLGLFEKHCSLTPEIRCEASLMMVMMEAICIIVGFNFIYGALGNNYFECS